jgi:hypothetical protein
MLDALHWSAKCAITQGMIRSQMKRSPRWVFHRDAGFPLVAIAHFESSNPQAYTLGLG